jgi:hypothetical protein
MELEALIMVKRIIVFVSTLLLSTAVVSAQSITQCPKTLIPVLDSVRQNCSNIQWYSVCYGYGNVLATFTLLTPEGFFTQPGDIINIDDLDTLRLGDIHLQDGFPNVVIMAVPSAPLYETVVTASVPIESTVQQTAALPAPVVQVPETGQGSSLPPLDEPANEVPSPSVWLVFYTELLPENALILPEEAITAHTAEATELKSGFPQDGGTQDTSSEGPTTAVRSVDEITIQPIESTEIQPLEIKTLETIDAGTEVLVDGISPDREWVRIRDPRQPMWVSRASLLDDSALESLPVIAFSSALRAAAVYFHPEHGSQACETRVNSRITGINYSLRDLIVYSRPSEAELAG